ncbi:hypothetical protein M0R45_020234 [Rubus argutus]|uniref:Uncharacterized protein n=1 Tax=Rubus argutus TaxID=59490 RepID=A0AAW1X9T9_RUBAR
MLSLRDLDIRNCDSLSSLPSGLNRCTSLQELTVSGCPNLASIPITQGMLSLRDLDIRIVIVYQAYRVASIAAPLSGIDWLYMSPSVGNTELWKIKCLAYSRSPIEGNGIGGLCEELDSFPDFKLPPNSQLERLELLRVA